MPRMLTCSSRNPPLYLSLTDCAPLRRIHGHRSARHRRRKTSLLRVRYSDYSRICAATQSGNIRAVLESRYQKTQTPRQGFPARGVLPCAASLPTWAGAEPHCARCLIVRRNYRTLSMRSQPQKLDAAAAEGQPAILLTDSVISSYSPARSSNNPQAPSAPRRPGR